MTASADNAVLVAGVGMTSFVGFRNDASVRDMVADAARAALLDAGLRTPSPVDMGVAAYESDHFNRQMSLGQVLSDTVGLTGKPVMRVEGGGATGALAIQTALMAIRSGEARSVLVFGGETNGRSVDRATAIEILSLSADFEWETPLFGAFAAPYALMITEHMRRYGTTEGQFAEIAVKNRRMALDNPLAHRGMSITVEDVRSSAPLSDPYRLFDASLLSDGAAAALLATEDWAEEHSPTFAERPPVAVLGSGSATDRPRLSDRTDEMFPHFAAKRRAAAHAYREAGIDNPPDQIDVAEVYDSFSGAELQAYEDLGLCPVGQGGQAALEGRFDREGQVVVNPSGGLMGRGSAVGATGIAQAVEVVSQLRGEVAPARQVPGARIGMTDTHAGVGSLSVVNVFGRVG
ncbi:MAG: thiolase family protein [Acidimicrobiia bacterium]|nr:thiolase family protein [Acidimicrobiia bacterium]MYH05791.1 thiolase family protein [Acidimicrobiia bacterium]MYK54881.1 thiolase family protein [Acidimicrobiia bacterium]